MRINLSLLAIISSFRLLYVYISAQLVLYWYPILIASQVRNPAARKAGLEVSLFRRLSTAHPHAVIDLTHQYRMNEDIMLLSNRLIYGDRLKCGTEEVARRTLVLPDGGKYLRMMHTSKQTCEKHCWMNKLLSERYVVDFSLD
jgi:DNA replication ATP-dependent helicase Dna2